MKPLSELGISPAPWRIVDSYQFPEGGEWVSVIKASNNKTVSVPTFYNARLIAAAPKLYEALRGLLEIVCDDCGSEYKVDGKCAKCPRVIAAEAALAEAAGEEVA